MLGLKNFKDYTSFSDVFVLSFTKLEIQFSSLQSTETGYWKLLVKSISIIHQNQSFKIIFIFTLKNLHKSLTYKYPHMKKYLYQCPLCLKIWNWMTILEENIKAEQLYRWCLNGHDKWLEPQ